MHKTTKKGYPQSVVYFKNELNKKKIESLKGHIRNTFTLIYFFQFFYVRRLSETTSARRWDISQNNLVTQEKVIFCFILLWINSTLFEQIETFSIFVYATSIPAWPLFNFCILKRNNEGKLQLFMRWFHIPV